MTNFNFTTNGLSGKQPAFRLFCIVFFLLITINAFSKDNVISIETDERIELLTVIQLLADWPDYFPRLKDPSYKTEYLDKINKTFLKFKNHPSVLKVRKFIDDGFSFDAPVSLIYHLGSPPSLAIAIPLPPRLLERIQGVEGAEEFISALRAFYADTDFHSFFLENKDYYSKVKQFYLKQIDDPNKYIAFLKKFSGSEVESPSYKVVLSTVFPHLNYGSMTTDGKHTIHYNTTSPGFIYGNHPSPIVSGGIPVYQKDGILTVLIHEFGHSVMNPLVDKFMGDFNKVAFLYDPVSDFMQKNAYTSWKICLYEHMARALVSAFIEITDGKDNAERELINQSRNWKFIYIREIHQLFMAFLNGKIKFTKFVDFFPTIVGHFLAYLPKTPK